MRYTVARVEDYLEKKQLTQLLNDLNSILDRMHRLISSNKKEKGQTRRISPVSGYGQPLRKELLRGFMVVSWYNFST